MNLQININKLVIIIFVPLFTFSSIGACQEKETKMTLQEMLFKSFREYDRKKSLELVQQVINEGADLNVKDKKTGSTALVEAAKSGNKEIVQLLLDAKANPNIQNKYDDTALIWATYNGNKEIVQLLLNAKANPDIQNDNGSTALILVARSRNKEIVQLLLNAKANPDIKNNDGSTALIEAARNKNKEIVQLLLDDNVNIDTKTKQNKTALDEAQEEGHNEIVQMLKDEPKRRQALKELVQKEAGEHLPKVLAEIVSEYVVSCPKDSSDNKPEKLV